MPGHAAEYYPCCYFTEQVKFFLEFSCHVVGERKRDLTGRTWQNLSLVSALDIGHYLWTVQTNQCQLNRVPKAPR